MSVIKSSKVLKDEVQLSGLSKNEIEDVTKAPNPKCTSINKALTVPGVQKLLWPELGLNSSFVFPTFGTSLLYGVVSSEVHLPLISAVYLSDESAAEVVKFFKDILPTLGLEGLKIECFAEVDAARCTGF